MLAFEPLVGLLAQTLFLMLLWKEICNEPFLHPLGIFLSGLPETKRFADLCSMVFDGATSPGILQIKFRCNINLCGNKGNHHAGDLIFEEGEASFTLKEFEQHRKSQPCRSGLVAHLSQIPRTQYPVFN